MPAQSTFSFGIGNYFKFSFSFSFGPPKDPPYPNGERDMDSGLDEAMAKRNGIQVDNPSKPVKPHDQSNCVLFTTFPPEIRQMIYRLLLTTPSVIKRPNKHLGSRDTIMLDNSHPYPDLDAAILRTCRLIYSEALPVLYGSNTFEFTCANDVRNFQKKNLTPMPIAFGLKLAVAGRLTMLRSVNLLMDSEAYHRHHSSADRDWIWREWTRSVFSDERDPHFSYRYRDIAFFPALERLKLDFTRWRLTREDGLLVKPFARSLEGHKKLHTLILKGVKHEETIKAFHETLVKEGGSFQVED